MKPVPPGGRGWRDCRDHRPNRSVSISRMVRKPSLRRTGTGGTNPGPHVGTEDRPRHAGARQWTHPDHRLGGRLCPSMSARSKNSVSVGPDIGQSSKDNPAEVPRAGFNAMMRGYGDVATGWKTKLQTAAVTPAGWLASNTGRKRRPDRWPLLCRATIHPSAERRRYRQRSRGQQSPIQSSCDRRTSGRARPLLA